MKVKYEFDLDNAENYSSNKDELEIFQQSNNMYLALSDISEKLRYLRNDKYDYKENEYEFIEKLCEEFYEILEDRKITIEL